MWNGRRVRHRVKGEKLIKNYVLFANEEFKINGLNKLSLSKQSNQINRTINSNKSKKKEFIIFNNSKIFF